MWRGTSISVERCGFKFPRAKCLGWRGITDSNIAMGVGSLTTNIGFANTAVGANGLYMATSFGNTAVGIDTLNQSSGSHNIAVGDSVLQDNTSGLTLLLIAAAPR
jgi:hypothetical protein